MPYSSLQSSPLVPLISPVKIYYRDEGEGLPLLFLHGGWGYGIYPFNRQIGALRDEYRMIIPDRGGYGRSTRILQDLPSNFHHRAAAETLIFLDSLDIERAFLWGHSDGAVIAAIIGFTAPDRVSGLILEAFHYYKSKPASREFFETLAYQPEALNAELGERFAREHGADYWQKLITVHAKAWLQIAVESTGPQDDLYVGRLHDVSAPTLIVHGLLDPRTEPGELNAVRQQLRRCEMQILEDGSHSPHSERATAELVNTIADGFLKRTQTGDHSA